MKDMGTLGTYLGKIEVFILQFLVKTHLYFSCMFQVFVLIYQSKDWLSKLVSMGKKINLTHFDMEITDFFVDVLKVQPMHKPFSKAKNMIS
jgi:hypothetical protein